MEFGAPRPFRSPHTSSSKKQKHLFFCLFLNVAPPLLPYVRNVIPKIPQNANTALAYPLMPLTTPPPLLPRHYSPHYSPHSSSPPLLLWKVPLKPHLLATMKSNNYLINAIVAMEAEARGANLGNPNPTPPPF